MEEEGGLPDGDEVFKEALAAVDEAGVGEGVKGAAEAYLVACERLESFISRIA